MSATITIDYDDGSQITFYDVDDSDIDLMVDNYLHVYGYTHLV